LPDPILALCVPRDEIVNPNRFQFAAALSRSLTTTTAWSIPTMFFNATLLLLPDELT
jgi:hypothetical protein